MFQPRIRLCRGSGQIDSKEFMRPTYLTAILFQCEHHMHSCPPHHQALNLSIAEARRVGSSDAKVAKSLPESTDAISRQCRRKDRKERQAGSRCHCSPLPPSYFAPAAAACQAGDSSESLTSTQSSYEHVCEGRASDRMKQNDVGQNTFDLGAEIGPSARLSVSMFHRRQLEERNHSSTFSAIG